MVLKEQKNVTKRQNDEESLRVLKELTMKLCSDDITIARLAGYNLSWKQEDGLAILTKILFGDFSRTSKKAAAYGLRSMKGRMRKQAIEVLEKGLKDRNRTTKAACIKALSLMNKGSAPKVSSNKEDRADKKKVHNNPRRK